MSPTLPLDPHGDDLRVIDTEGTPVLREVAVLDGRGQLLYEARTPDEDAEYYAADLIRPLPELLRDLRQQLQGHRIVAHNAPHDSGVLAASFEACGLQPPSLEWHCTLELAQQLHPGCASFALGPLCDELQVGSEPFCRDAAHQAAYDARFTYRLYRRLQRDQHSRRLAGQPNPFHSSRVDTPFQHFVDDRKVHEAAFLRLSSVLRSVTSDHNQQSQGAVLVGEPGSGKTHLVMRLADEVLRNNRLLFVRQPNQAASVLFHIYSRTLESLVEPVGDTSHSQLDLLLIRALRRIMQDSIEDPDLRTSTMDREILAALEEDDLRRLGQEGSDARRNRWERLETRLLRWWADRHSAAGSGRQILQGLVRFCRYTQPNLRESCRRWLATGECEPVDRELEGLSPWNGELEREEFSLQALRVLGLLSSLDAPLILVFDQLEGLWQENNRPVLLRFAEVVKELFTHMPHTLILVALFPDRWQQFQRDFDGSITGRVGQHVIPLETPRPDQIEEILDMRLEPLGVKALDLFSEDDLEQIVRMPSLRSGLNRASAIFEHRVNGVPLPPVPPPPPPPLRLNGDGALSSQPRLLHLEEQIEQILERLERLERPGSDQAQANPPAADANTEERQNAEPAIMPAVSDPPRPRAAGEIGSDNPYSDLFRRYREHARDSLRERWKSPPIIDDSDDAGKLRQICLGYQQIRRLEVDTLRLGKKKVPDNVVINLPKSQYCVAFLHLANANSIQARLSNLNQLVMRHRQVQFILMRDASAPEIRSKGASAALQAFLNGCGDGVQRTHERTLDLERRLALEFVHQLVSDILNRELDVPLRDGLQLLAQVEPDNWVVKMLHPMRRAG
jgi:Cdc6-like AAA superfamily ATPase